MIVLFVGFAMLTSGASAGTIFFYGENLPGLKDFKTQFQFQNTLIRDARGNVLYDMADLSNRSRGKRVVEPLQAPGHDFSYYRQNNQDWLVPVNDRFHPGIPLNLQNATIATEDSTFYNNPGFDPMSIARATIDNLVKGHVVSGASTITQQLVRRYMLGFSPTLTRKTEEVILATELTQKYPKTKILWYYLNSIPYGNLSIGAQAASQTYFHKPVWQLDYAQCALLAGLPQAPSVYDPVNNKAVALNRMNYVLDQMYSHGYLRDSNGNPDPSKISAGMREARTWKFSPPTTSKKFPHFVQYAVQALQNLAQTNDKLRGRVFNGLDVTTSIDPVLQDAAQKIVKVQVGQLVGFNVSDGALVSIDVRPSCYGCILAMVGSADYTNKAIHGQINMADRPRQPGSSFKPFTYAYAFMHGAGPGTTVLDAPVAIPDTGNPDDNGWFEPTNYDHLWHGTVTLRTALQNSLNVPAVKVEQYDTSVDACTDGLLCVENQALKQGVTSIKSDNPKCCGWALTLGGMEHGLRLVEETAAYGAFATTGMTVPPVAIKFVRDRISGTLLYDYRKDGPKPVQAVTPAAAYVINNVLSDNPSRCAVVCEFGLDSPLYLGRAAAAKTGTTTGFTDNWTVGYTPDIVTGVWVGNADNQQMYNTTGVTGAAPIWHDFMLAAFDKLHLPPKNFVEPPEVYSSSTCRIVSNGYYSPGSTAYDIWAILQPVCSLGTTNTYLPVPQQNVPYQPPAVQAPQLQATAPPPPTAPAQNVPGAQPPVQSAPLQQSQPTIAPLPPTAVPPVLAAPTAVPPAVSPPRIGAQP